MKINVGFEMIFECPKPTPMIFNLNVHYTRVSDLLGRDALMVDPPVPMKATATTSAIGAPASSRRRDAAGSVPTRPSPTAAARRTGSRARQTAVEDLPDDTLIFLLGSRYCDTDRLSQTAWDLFGQTPTGWDRVQAICDYVHRHITFDYEQADNTRTALEAFTGRVGGVSGLHPSGRRLLPVHEHSGAVLHRLSGDIGMPPPYGPMDFAAWFEVFLDGQWHTFDARNNVPRIGRVLIARGRDAADVALSNAFGGANTLTGFRVWTDEVG